MKGFVLNITNRCNFRCGHCFREGCTAEDLDIDLVKKCLPAIKAFGVRRLSLTGGEPVLHPEFPRLVELLANEGFKIGVVTNCWFYRRYIDVLEPFRKRVAYVAVSLDAHTAADHDDVRAKPGSFDRVLEAIEAFHKEGYRINVSHVVNRHTAQDLESFGAMMADMPVFVNIGAVVPAEGNDPWQLDPEQRQSLPATARLVEERLGDRVSFTTSLGLNRNYMFCGNFRHMNDVTLRYDGDVLLCCDAPNSNRGAVLGNVHDEPLADIIPRFAGRIGTVLTARLAAMEAGHAATCNDCTFCNQILAENFGDTNPSSALDSARPDAVNESICH